MDPNSILDSSHKPELAPREKLPDWPGLETNDPGPSGEFRFPAEDSGKSLAELAQKDLTATLQLLAEQAQYITGASGAAIALRDHGEMVCRASAGPSAPEVGSLLQVDSGLSGESVRTRQTLRCDDAAVDPRVNRETCEALGIASVVVMPLMHSNEVIGVFELFSDKAHVFQGRDITALERMGTMVFTVLEQAMAAHGVTIWPQRTNVDAQAATRDPGEAVAIPESSGATVAASPGQTNDTTDGTKDKKITPETNDRGTFEPDAFPEVPETVSGITFHGSVQEAGSSELAEARSSNGSGQSQDEGDQILGDVAKETESSFDGEMATPTRNPLRAGRQYDANDEDSILDGEQISTTATRETRIPAEHSAIAEPADAVTPIRSELANLKKCAACGFPISDGRRLCLDCEKKQVRAGDVTPGTVAEVDRAFESDDSPAEPVPDKESASAAAPQFLRDDQDDAGWLARHKYMVVAIGIAVIIIVSLLLAR